MYIKVTKDCYVPEENIKFYTAYSVHAIKKIVKNMKEEGKIIDLSGRKKAATVIMLKSGEAIITALAVDTIAARTEN